MAVKDLRPKKVASIYKTLESLIMLTDNVDDLTMLSIVMFISARQIMLTSHGIPRTLDILDQLREEILPPQNLPKIHE